MKKLLLLLVLLLALSARADDAAPIGSWQLYPSYTIATAHAIVGHTVYALMDGNLLRYDTDDGSVKTYDRLEELHDVHINHIAYSTEAHRLILVYDNSNIDLIDTDDRVVNLSALCDKAIGGKEVNSVCVVGANAYLCTGFGLVVVDMREGVVSRTYQLGKAVTAMTATEDRFYFATADGIYYTAPDANLYEDDAYHLLTANRNIRALEVVGKDETLVAWGLYSVIAIGRAMLTPSATTFFNKLSDGSILYGDALHVYHLTTDLTLHTYDHPNDFRFLTLEGKTLWVSDGLHGLRPYRYADDRLEPSAGAIQPNSPVRDLFYRLHYEDGRLLAAGGAADYFNLLHPGTAMIYDGAAWLNFDEAYRTAHPDISHTNFTDLAQDPADTTHHFVGTFRSGLYEFRSGRFVKLYNCDNSPLRSILPDNAHYNNYCGAMGAKYDSEGRLWLLNNQTDTIVRLIEPNGRWRALYYPEIANVETPTDYLFTRSGVNFVVSQRMEGRGFFGFYTNGTLTSTRDDNHILRTTIVNEDNTSYTPDGFFCMAEDLDGQVWCGTNIGLFVIEDPTQYFQPDFHFEQIKIPRNDGSGLADYLLSGVTVTAIAVDGGNRKWVGTSANGVYLLSPDGQEMIHHFQTDNSPLLSDNIESIAIHPTTGRVMIGTDKGLCSYLADATAAEETLSFDNVKVYPNPVRPDYRGPITIEGLTRDAELKICGAAGQLVATTTSNGGRATWNGLDHTGRRVASGVYQIIASDREGKNAVVARVVVIR